MSSVIGIINIINSINVLKALFVFLFSRTCDVSCTCRVSEILNLKPTIKCSTKNHRLSLHNKNTIIDR